MIETDEVFTSYDGLTLHGTYSRPPAQVRAAALLVHGITANREEWGFYTRMAAYMADLGAATLRFDYRCHGVDTTPFDQLSLSGIVNDIDAAHSHLVKRSGAALPTYIMGTSFGGGLSAFWAARHPGALKGLFLCAPVISYEDDVRKTAGPWQEPLARSGHVDYVGHLLGRPLINEMPYINGINALASPPCRVVIFHGDADSDVPIESSRRYVGSSGLVSLIVVEGAEHGFVVPGDGDATAPGTLANHQFVYQHMREIMFPKHGVGSWFRRDRS